MDLNDKCMCGHSRGQHSHFRSQECLATTSEGPCLCTKMTTEAELTQALEGATNE